jgi:hypothetical protein
MRALAPELLFLARFRSLLSLRVARGNPQLLYWATTVTETAIEFGGLQAFASQA